MREWMREKLMRRRSKRGPNDSESTGKIGQEIPTNQPAPLRPAYPDPVKSETKAAPQPDIAAEMHGLRPGEATVDSGEPARSAAAEQHSTPAASVPEPPRLEVETQPASLG